MDRKQRSRAAIDDGAPRLYVTLFERPAMPAPRKAKAALSRELNVCGAERTTASPPCRPLTGRLSVAYVVVRLKFWGAVRGVREGVIRALILLREMKVEVEVQTLAQAMNDFEAVGLVVAPNIEGVARLKGTERADEPSRSSPSTGRLRRLS